MESSDYATWQAALIDTPGDAHRPGGRLDEPGQGAGDGAPSSPGGHGLPEHGIALLRDLMASEREAGRFGDLLVSWAADVTGAVAHGDFMVAAAWLNAVLVAPTYPTEMTGYVEAAFDTLSRPRVLDDLLVRLAGAEAPEGGPELVGAWGSRLADHMIDLMAVDDPPVSRKRLVEFLGWAGRSDVRLLAAHVGDSRWFVARNLAIALGKTGRASAVTALEHLAAHPEPRVRVEALRSLALLDGEGTMGRVAEALGDRSSRVRHAALTLLRANPSPAVVPALTAALGSGRAGPAQARSLVAAIAERRHDGVVEALQRLAGRRFAVGAARAGRDAARSALDRLGRRS